MKYVYLGIGGLLGTFSRYWVSTAVHEAVGRNFPYGTMAVNAIGCLVAGFFATMGQGSGQSAEMRLLLIVGFCGAFTTFSTLTLETGELFRNGAAGQAVLNIVLSLAAGSLALVLGVWMGNKI